MVEAADDDPDVRACMADVRPALDPVVRSVLRANVEAALFGKQSTVAIGRYQLLREVGTGGGGSVFVARDPELNREIAIKLIVAANEELRARALAEGQALARLSHPNIVPVFDVGVAEERVFLVMELVRGESLRAYAARASRREIVAAYRQAGEGLAAAHDAGLVHRDFKPDNAVIGTDKRVRVIDFGLARTAADDAPRGVSGTPGYMAPEQRAGAAVTAATDQYAFAVALREALGTPLPRWVELIVSRATADDPSARFPSLPALLAALANDPRKRWARRALIAAPVAFAVIGFAVGRGGDEVQARCDGRAAVADVWTPERSAAVAQHVKSLATPFGAVSAPRARDAIDRYAARWIDGYRTTCAAARREDPLALRRAACLDRARRQLGEALTLLGEASAEQLPPVMTAIAELPELARCADDNSLADNVAPPPAAQAKQVDALVAELDRVQLLIVAAAPDAVTRVSDLVRRARALGYRPLLARALLAGGRAELAAGRRDGAIAPLTEATELALAAGDTATAVEAFARAAWAKLASGTAPDAAKQGIELVVALADQLGRRDAFARALLHNNAGTIENAAGNVEGARAHYTAALALARDVDGPGRLELGAVRSNLALVTDDPAERARLIAERVTLLHEALGDEHPWTLNARVAAAFAMPDDVAARDAARPLCETYSHMHPSHGAAIVECASELLWLQLATADSSGARASAALVLAAKGEDLDPIRVGVASAYAAMLDGDPRAARARFDELAARVAPKADTPWWELLFAADVELGRALVARAQQQPARGALAAALGYLERAAAANPNPMIARRITWVKRAME